MKNSTISENIDEVVIDLQSEMWNPSNTGKIGIIVEGEDDIRLYQKLFDKDSVFLYCASNWYFVVEATKRLSLFQDRIIGIKDADFDRVLGTDYSEIPNLFQTDTHDAETLIINNDIINNLLLEYVGYTDDTLISNISEQLSWFSYLRLFNQVNGNGIRFKGFGIGKIFSKPNYTINPDYFLQKVQEHGDNSKITNFPNKNDIENIKNTLPITDPLILSNGHDLTNCLGIYISGKTKSGGISGKDICRQLRIHYSINTFRQTELYKSIDQWSRQYDYNLWAS